MTTGHPSFEGRTVLVTGAAGGLGRALALGFSAAGARIVALDRDAAGLDSLRAELESAGRDCLALPCDVTLLGTGARQRFPAPALLRPLIEAGRGVEVMDTHAACRTYNVLVAEGRTVVAALIIE